MNEPAAREEVLKLMRELERESAHVLHVTKLALELFDQLASEHRLNSEARFLLEAAALLHDIGWSVVPDGTRHHKVSARLIRDHDWIALDPEAVSLVALVARYHRGNTPAERHQRFRGSDPADRQRVRFLAGMLRVADGLDRRHLQYVSTLEAVVSKERIVLQLMASATPDQEIATAERKGDLMRDVFQRELAFVVVP